MGRRLRLVCFVVSALLIASLVNADILWDTCLGKADHPSIKEGNYFNLCIINEEFSDKEYAWTFINTTITTSNFENCTFWNNRERTTTFTGSNWNSVIFQGCRFGSFNEHPMIFDNLVMTNVHFRDCIFHNSANLNFTKVLLNNVTFTNSKFEGDTNFELGELNLVTFDNCQFQRSEAATTPSGDDAFRLRQITARDFSVIDSYIVNPLRIEGVAAADMTFNDSTINEFWCHSIPDEKKQGEVKYYSGFNDTAFQACTFTGNVHCDLTTWDSMFMANITFLRNAYFQNSDFLGLYWDEIKMQSATKESLELDFSKTNIKREVLANTTIVGTANFREAKLETLYVNNVVATKPIFEDTEFINQEYIDGHCCSKVCVPLKCKCNVSEPSGECPVGRSDVNTSAIVSCFPADATVSRHDGLIVRMEDLAFAEKIATGAGHHSDVYFFGHRNANEMSEYVSIKHTGSETPLRISPGHYLYVDGSLRTARTVKAGQRLRNADGEDALVVADVYREQYRGVYAPTSMHGDLVVDGVTVSSYTDVMHPGLSHKLLYPLRLLYRYGFDRMVSRMTMLHERSLAHFPRTLGIPRGPEVIEI